MGDTFRRWESSGKGETRFISLSFLCFEEHFQQSWCVLLGFSFRWTGLPAHLALGHWECYLLPAALGADVAPGYPQYLDACPGLFGFSALLLPISCTKFSLWYMYKVYTTDVQ